MIHSSNTSRRQFLAGVGATGAGAFLARGLRAQNAGPRAIDCHHHFTSPAWIKAMEKRDGQKTAGFTTWFALPQLRPYSPTKDLEDMDREGVQTGMLSCTTPGIWFGDPDETVMLAREMNDYAAKMVSDHKTRFGLFALLPLPLIDPSLKEIAYAFDTLKADGVGLLTSYGNHWLGDPAFRPVMDELNRRGAVVYVHPTDAPCCQELFPGSQPGAVEYNTDTARTIFSLLYQNAATRYGNIKFIFSHGGGTLPFLVSRFEREEATLKNKQSILPRGLRYELRKFYYEIAQANHPGALDALLRLVPATQVLFGTDYPYRPAGEAVEGLAAYKISPADRQAIERENVLRLFPAKK